MNEKIRNYFDKIIESHKNDGFPLTEGMWQACRTYEFNVRSQSSEFECDHLPWDTDMSDFVKTMREAGVETIAVTERSSSLIESLHKLAEQGCTVKELCTVTRPDIWHEPEEIPAIRIMLN